MFGMARILHPEMADDNQHKSSSTVNFRIRVTRQEWASYQGRLPHNTAFCSRAKTFR